MSKQKQTFFQKAQQGMLDLTNEDVFIGANENEGENNDEPFDDEEDSDIDQTVALDFPPLQRYTDLKVFDNPIVFNQSLSLVVINSTKSYYFGYHNFGYRT